MRRGRDVTLHHPYASDEAKREVVIKAPVPALQQDAIPLYQAAAKAAQEQKKDHDAVNHPSHYASGGIECISAIEAQLSPEEFQGYLRGNVVKYVWRWREKGGGRTFRRRTGI